MAEEYIVVDVETSGPNPGAYALLAIGACTLNEPRETFYIELQPSSDAYDEEAMAVHGLSLDRLSAHGMPPAEAMRSFAEWVSKVSEGDEPPVFVAFNAPFDWMFVNEYFHTYLGFNPFGYKALDIKAYFMGMRGVAWSETSHRSIGARYDVPEELTHHALKDALQEAKLFEQMLRETGAHS
jgi:DNA polymerase III epsilon subunit-like protein